MKAMNENIDRSIKAISMVVPLDRVDNSMAMACENMFLVADRLSHKAWQVDPDRGMFGEQDYGVVMSLICAN